MSDDDDDTRLIRPRDPREPEEPEEPPVPGVQTQTPNLISWWTWIAYSQGHVYNDLCASMWFTYLLPYFQKCVLLSPSNAGLLMLIGQVADALATPVIGLYSDRGSTAWYCALGRRKTWHIIGSVLVTFSFPFIFSPVLPFLDFSSSVAHVAYFVPFICLFQFFFASCEACAMWSLTMSARPFSSNTVRKYSSERLLGGTNSISLKLSAMSVVSVIYFSAFSNPEEGYYYRLALAYGCGIPCLVGILALLFFPPVPQVRLNIRNKIAFLKNMGKSTGSSTTVE
ncbi:major facilitator superfamily domain-containing protein 12-like [Diaphorina citri]|uniref:Major facilitator superfamily domain-containing protein 12-like n=1 Tax=Diaphorina citri TaxID=121845 RepID=A0A3Q0JCG1_DIACI|nr:major facilitator superfamily domain-containing protein 12-like [Diaphorina citri]